MPLTDPHRRRRQLIWRIAGLWMVVLALGLAVAGIVQALQHARSLALRLMAPVEVRARAIADAALEQFERELAAGLRDLADHVRAGTTGPWQSPGRFPVWMDGLYAFDGETLTVIVPPSLDSEDLLDFARSHLTSRWERPTEEGQPCPDLLYGTAGETPVVLACAKSTDGANRPVLVAASLNLERLKTHLVEPHLIAGGGLELVRVRPDERDNPWSQQLFSAMRFWAIQPTESFIREQKRAVIGQTLVHLALTLLALATLLIAMGVLVRVLRRDMALAEMKANFVADVSHELKTPLALIRLFGETLQSGRVTSEAKRQEYYEIITRESTRLAALINNILDFARIEAGRKEYVLEPTDIADVVRETYDAYRAQLEHAGFEHHLTIADGLPPVRADRGAIAQALINLISNAVKYSGEERYLAVDVGRDTRRGKRGVLISVHDRGIGIRAEDRAHLFDGFFRASDPRVREAGGTGMGLSLVKHIVDSHSGLLDVESRLVKGSTFRIFLPAWEQPAPSDAPAGSVRTPSEGSEAAG